MHLKNGNGVPLKAEKKLPIYATPFIPFSKEDEFYNSCNAKTKFVGHPIIDICDSTMTKEALFEQFNISSKKYCIGLFPGTREQEIKHLTPIFMETIKLLNKEHDQYQFFCPLTDKKSINKVQSLLDKNNLHNVQIYEGNSSDIIQAADASIAKMEPSHWNTV